MGRRRKGRDVHGWLVIDKPAGIGSTPVVGRARRSLDARKAGHAGTLDPDATGVLAVAFGEATKTVPFVTDAPKGYRFRVAWGAETHTDDAAGEVVETSDARPTRDAVEAALPAFRGEIAQVPPFVSAVKVDGARAYDLARAGERPELAPRPLRVDRLDLTAFDDDGAEFVFECGKGGYVRSVARDLGRALGCLGHVAWLRREWSGPFRAEDGVGLEALEGDVSDRLLPLEAGLGGLAEVRVDAVAAARLSHGNPAEALTGASPGETVWASLDGRAVAVGRYLGGMVQPTKVFVR
ncbi:tRNA pseudouridine(55) synthase TruB [Jannaschia sp. Os4]|uniref:tRNA pseudouridine(55) synthase TruB n=1 Tax=Jannaschia sp. Os4 TaxID=2807617 RepID=UPI00193AD4C0|nr:tRNA pseudouridine(55) synthase TruB [Jannaschia sp. Os4]MBM2574795.1 tRNA pseudouridine(55) synthase TruB [Jannaschia sp. Os4]